MADASSRGIDSAFQGLVTTTAIFAAVGGAAAIAYEVLRQFRRLPDRRPSKFWRRDPQSRHAPGGVHDTAAHTRTKDTCEDWEMGHLYHARVFHATKPSPPLPRWPFAWIKRAIQFNDLFYAEHTGMDTVVYVRFLRACFYWVLLQTLTTAPILLTIHIKFSRGVSSTDMARASLSYLVAQPVDPSCVDTETKCETQPNYQGRSLLWIHLTLLWYLSITWVLALWWVGSGSLRIRKALVAKTRDKVSQSRLDQESAIPPSSDNSDGWRQRTLMVMNLPATMRDEASIRRYFEEFLRPDEGNDPSQGSVLAHSQIPEDANKGTNSAQRLSSESDGPSGGSHVDRHLKSPIQTVVLVRKMNELASMLARRQDVLNQLEAAHVKLAQDVLVTVAKRTAKMRKRDSQHPSNAGSTVELNTAQSRVPHRLATLLHRKSHPSSSARPGESTPTETSLPPDLEKMGPTSLTDAAKANQDDLARRLARFSPSNRGMHPQEAQLMGSVHSKDDNEMGETIWEALHQLPRELLDPFQPATRLSALFRGQTVPTIDYLLTKLNLLTALVTEMRSRPSDSYEPTTTAFVTFRDPRQARMVWRELKDQIVVKVRLAPEVKDLDWDRLMKTSFTGDVVRSIGVAIGTWAFTIFWVIIINFITIGVFSVKNLKQIPGLNGFFERNPNIEGFVSITLPPIIVSLISMSIPELIFQVSKRAQGFVTFSALYDMCLVRYWKFVICNVVIFFCVGSTAIETILTKVGDTGSILDTIGTAFPTAAPFFVSYMILQLALQSGFEHIGFMIALLQHFGANKAVTPRMRAIKTLPRNFNRYYWLPLHLNIMAIVFIFALLNPLMIPFTLVYLAVALVVFKKNFAYHYYRRFNEMEGVIYFTRMLRFTLDSIIVMQVVLLIFFSVIQEGAVYIGMTAVLIPLTVIVKVVATRFWKAQCRAIDDDEADALCGIQPREETLQATGHESPRSQEGIDAAAPIDARASGRYPTVMPPPTTGSNFNRVWQKVHDSFNANGLDKPSYLATAHANGRSIGNPVETGARGIAKTPRYVISQTAKHAFHYKSAAKALGTGNNSARASMDQAPSPREQVSGLPATSRLHEHRFASSQGSHSELENTATPAQAASVSKKRKGDYGRSPMSQLSLRRGGSRRSEERPFLSGFDAVSAHAPIPSEDDYDLSFEDGDAPFLARSEEEQYEMIRRHARRKSGNHGTVKRKRSQLATVIDEDAYDTTIEDVEMRRKAVQSSDPLSASEDGYGAGSPLAMQTAFASRGTDESDEDDEELSGRDLVRMHPPVRWDDTPNNSARYNNPFYNQDLDGFLWLPRNPIAPMDLCDTIEWFGPALVSSQGGRGIIGEWDDDQESLNGDHDYDDEKGMTTDDEIPFGGEAADMGRSHDVLLEGHEEIVLPSSLARHLEQVETVEDAEDPGAKVPRNMMEQYKRAIRKNSVAASDASSGERDSSSLFRRPSIVSASSAHGYVGSDLLQVPSGNSGASGGRQSPDAPASPKLVRKTSSHLDRKGSADPLSSVPESGVMIPHRSTSRRVRNEGANAESHNVEVDLEGQRTPRHQAGVAFAPGDETQPTQASPSRVGVHDQSASKLARRNTSGPMSRASGFSADTNQRTVTLRAALRAEALEEERRITLRERLAVSKRRKKGQHASGAPDDLPDKIGENGDDDALETASTIHPNDTIMGRYEAQHRRREASEFGAKTGRDTSQSGDVSHARDISTGSMFRNTATSANDSSRFRSAAVGVLNLSRASRVVKRNNGDTNAPAAMAMQDLGSANTARPRAPRTDATGAEAGEQSLAVQDSVVPSASMPSIAESATPTPSDMDDRPALQTESTPAKPRNNDTMP